MHAVQSACFVLALELFFHRFHCFVDLKLYEACSLLPSACTHRSCQRPTINDVHSVRSFFAALHDQACGVQLALQQLVVCVLQLLLQHLFKTRSQAAGEAHHIKMCCCEAKGAHCCMVVQQSNHSNDAPAFQWHSNKLFVGEDMLAALSGTRLSTPVC